jgi:Fuc2NAc and GlcNAc transferase
MEIKPWIRLFFQFALAFLFLFNIKSWPPSVSWSIALTVLLTVYIVGTANMYNFMDGINGIAAITGAIGFFLLGGFSLSSGAGAKLPLLLFTVAVACLGFLPFNFPRARVFMGDTGSTFLGFLFAGTTVYLARDLNDFFVLIACLFPFYADELTTMLVRVRDRENITQAHRRHLYQLLANEGQWPHWQVTLAYGLGQIVIASMAWWLRSRGLLPLLIMLATFFAGFAILSAQVRKKLRNS